MDNKTDQSLDLKKQFDLDKSNLDASEISWPSTPLPRNSREIGNKVTNSAPNYEHNQNEQTLEVPTNDFNQLNDFLPNAIFEDASPKNQKQQRQQDTAAIEEALNVPFDSSAFKTTDKLDQTGVEAIDTAIEKLNQDGDIASFYDTARQMMEANLDNSYNRKIGEGQ